MRTEFNKHIALLALLAGTFPAIASPVSVEKAKEELVDFQMQNGELFSTRHKVSGVAELTLAYTSVGDEGNCFYIFNAPDNGGFTIVSADDRLPLILGFSESGSFDDRRMPDNMRWWLGEYQKEISTFLREDPSMPSVASRARRMRKKVDREPVTPLLKTTWDQTAPYNNDCPVDTRTGQRSVTGCVATAMAQVMKYHEWPLHPQGSANGVIFNNTTLDWENMRDSYANYNWTSAQAAAVALLMRQCGASVSMQYSSYASGAYSFNVPNALIEYFDYNPSMQIQYRDYFTQNQWNDMVYEELAARRPVYYSGQSNAGGHAFVCDGYLGNDLYHFNWGWSGYQDGYFRLNALNPSTGGTGSYSGGYNEGQSIVTGVKRSEGETKRQQLLLSTGAFEYESDNVYTITNGGEYNIIYNPLAYSQTFYLGLKVTPVAGDGEPAYYRAYQQQTLASMYGFPKMEVSIGALPDGKYKVSPAMFTSYDEWQDIRVPYGLQSYVILTVEKGKKQFSNEGPGEETKSELITSYPEFVSPLYAGDALAFRMTVSNVGQGDFYGSSIIGLYPESGTGNIVEMSSQVSVPGMSSSDVTYTESASLDSGSYELYLFDTDYNVIGDAIKIDVRERKNQPQAPQGELLLDDVAPSFMEDGSQTGVSITALNSSTKDISTHLVVRLLRARDLSEVDRVSTTVPFTFPANDKVTAHFLPRVFNLPAGNYYWICEDGEGKPLSILHPLKVYGKQMETEKGYYRAVDVASNSAELTAVKSETGATSYNIEEWVEGYKVTSIRPDVFTFNDEVKAVTLPSGISLIPSGEFYMANSLEYLKMNRETPPVLADNVFNEEIRERVIISGADGGYTNIFKESDDWSSFRMSMWNLDIERNVDIIGGLLEDPAGDIYNPYYIGADESPAIQVRCAEDELVVCDYEINGVTGRKVSDSVIKLPGLYGNHGRAHLYVASKSEAGEIAGDEIPEDIYTADGIYLGKGNVNKTFSAPGIYIQGRKKIIVRP